VSPRTLASLLAAVAVLEIACATASSVGFEAIQEQHGVVLSSGPVPQGATPLGLVMADEVGFYLGGVLPVVRAELQSCAERLAAQAQALGADGVAELDLKRFDVAVRLRWAGVWLDWDREVQLKGIAYRAAPARLKPR